MPEVSSFVYCENLREDKVGDIKKTVLVAPIANINLPSLPSFFSYCFSFGIFDGDNTIDNRLKCVLIDPNGAVLHATTEYTVIKLKDNPATPPEDLDKGIQFNLEYKNVRFDSEGKYKTEVYLNDVLVASCPIKITKG